MKHATIGSMILLLLLSLANTNDVQSCSCTTTSDTATVYTGFYTNCGGSGGITITLAGALDLKITYEGEKHCLVSYDYNQGHKDCIGSQANLNCENDGTWTQEHWNGGGCKLIGCKSLTLADSDERINKVANACL